jgi:hypothetical protein
MSDKFLGTPVVPHDSMPRDRAFVVAPPPRRDHYRSERAYRRALRRWERRGVVAIKGLR